MSDDKPTPKAKDPDAAAAAARDAELKRQQDIIDAVKDAGPHGKPGEAQSVSWEEPGLGK